MPSANSHRVLSSVNTPVDDFAPPLPLQVPISAVHCRHLVVDVWLVLVDDYGVYRRNSSLPLLEIPSEDSLPMPPKHILEVGCASESVHNLILGRG